VVGCCEEGNEISVLHVSGNFMAERLPAFQELFSSMEFIISLVYKNLNSECQGSVYTVLACFMNVSEYIEIIN
jgi:hypothetical protein